MKNAFAIRTILLIGVCCIFFLNTKAQTDSSNTASVYFMRTIGDRASMGALNVFIDTIFECKLNEKRYSIHNVSSGTHTFSVQVAGKKSNKKIEKISIDLKPGKTYYIQLAVQYATFVNYFYCQEVTLNTANLVLPKLKEDKNCGNKIQ
jgi:hypothetical protein